MTREEAIKAIRSHCYFANLVPVGKEALDMAIKALEKETCEDAISRQAALEALEQEEPLMWCDGADEIAAYDQWANDVDTIKNMPPVQPKPKMGHWIHRSTDDYGGITTWYECSECGRAVADIYHVYDEYPYCHCGARMIDPQEGANE